MPENKHYSLSEIPLFIKDALRFLIAGSFNTLFTLAIYQLALLWISHQLAYLLSWCCGFVFLVCIYPSKVFPGSSTRLSHYFLIGFTYLSVFLLGLKVLNIIVDFGIAAQIAIFMVMAVTTLMNFLLMRLILRAES